MPYQLKNDAHSGLLHVRAPTSLPGYWRYLPSPELAPYIEHYWTVEWDLTGPRLIETLPYPSAHVILEPGLAQLSGVPTQKFSRVLSGKSRVLGAKFWPGGLRAFVSAPVSSFTDKVSMLHEVFGEAARDLDSRVLIHADHQAAIAVLESFLHGLVPRHDQNIALARDITMRIADDRQLKSVEQLAEAFSLSKRTLQRLFGEYVGVSPKWVIRRYRLQEAAESMAAAQTLDWPQLALELGYTDQAHFIREFKRLIGKTPADYFRGLSIE
jgi:AraC-like DNA-binding protein